MKEGFFDVTLSHIFPEAQAYVFYDSSFYMQKTLKLPK